MLIQLVLDTLAATVAKPLVAKHQNLELQPSITRSGFVRSVPLDKPVLEIGPFDRPWLSGPNVRYFDVLSQEGLRIRATAEPKRRPGKCPFIHYVSPTGDLSVVDDEFGAVFSSHCIEHQPDLIRHLREVERLLQPGGGYYLIIPDKRFCFDHFLPESSIDEVRAAKGRTHHTETKIEEHTVGLTHNNNVLHWLGLHGRSAHNDPYAQTKRDKFLRQARAGEYVDVHAWQFTPTSFTNVIQSLFANGDIALKPARVHDTGFAKIEFMAVLERAD